jgi:hypothetical protein
MQSDGKDIMNCFELVDNWMKLVENWLKTVENCNSLML